MKPFCKISTVISLACFALSAQPARAQETTDTEGTLNNDNVATPVDTATDATPADSDWMYAKRYSQRSLTLQKGMIRADGIVTVWDDGVDTIVGMDIGGAIGVTDDFEIGLSNYRVGSSLQRKYESPISVVFTPDAGYGDIPLYGRYRFLHRDKLEIAGDLVFILPSSTAFALEAGIPIRIRPNDKLSVDTGAEVRGTFGSAERAEVRIPAIVNYNFSDRAFISGETGVYFVNMGKNFDTPGADFEGIDIPVGFRAGGTWKKADKHLIDLFSGFAFNQLIEAGTSRKTIDFGVWDIYVALVFHTHPLF